MISQIKHNQVISHVTLERCRQENLKREGKFTKTCADDMTNLGRLAVLAEEFGEVSKEVCEEMHGKDTKAQLRVESIQIAAVAVAWVEGLDDA